jgi:hypothetical protein
MLRRLCPALVVVALGLVWSAAATPARGQAPPGPFGANFFHYPYYYFPHNYWPNMGPPYPECPGKPYMRPPAYMAFPPFKEPNWRYEYWEPQSWHRGSHFWLDVF